MPAPTEQPPVPPPPPHRRLVYPLALAALVGLVATAWADDPSGVARSLPDPAVDGGPLPSTPEPFATPLVLAPEPKTGLADAGTEEARAALPPVPSRVTDPPIAKVKPLPKRQDLLALARRGPDGRYEVTRDGQAEPLTIVPSLQAQLTQILRNYQTPYAAVVALDPATGHVLAMVEHSEAAPTLRGLTTKAVFPAASIFKLVTATALLEEGVPADEEECFHGGKRRLSPKLLVDSERDGQCYDLGTALAQSANVVFAKLTLKHLSAQKLRARAEALRFNRSLSFPIPTDISLAAIPEDDFGLANTGAGFGDVYLSPLHGAALAAAVANGGLWRSPVLFARDAPTAPAAERVMTEEQARALTDMMEQTVTVGTARPVFRERGMRVKGAVGKTGSLADKRPFRDYSWFVGFAPRDAPRVAVAAVIVNDPRWRIRAPWLAREAMRLYLAESSGGGAAPVTLSRKGR